MHEKVKFFCFLKIMINFAVMKYGICQIFHQKIIHSDKGKLGKKDDASVSEYMTGEFYFLGLFIFSMKDSMVSKLPQMQSFEV